MVNIPTNRSESVTQSATYSVVLVLVVRVVVVNLVVSYGRWRLFAGAPAPLTIRCDGTTKADTCFVNNVVPPRRVAIKSSLRFMMTMMMVLFCFLAAAAAAAAVAAEVEVEVDLPLDLLYIIERE
jgi:hypothetical protein